MHLLAALSIFFGFVLVTYLGLAQVIWDLSDMSRQLQFTPAFVDFGFRLQGLIRTVSSNFERRFATFADVAYHEPVSRQQWELLWKAGP
jgi:hypothetical protein